MRMTVLSAIVLTSFTAMGATAADGPENRYSSDEYRQVLSDGRPAPNRPNVVLITADDLNYDSVASGAGIGRSPERYHAHTKAFVSMAQEHGKPFFLMANIHDPHRPFAGSEQENRSWGHDLPKVTRRIGEDEITVPEFLPDLPDIRKELAQYYTSVHRCDQSVGAVLAALKCRADASDIWSTSGPAGPLRCEWTLPAGSV